MTNNYELFKTSYSIDFKRFDKSKAQDFLKWWESVEDERLEQLREFFSDKMPDLKFDYSKKSLFKMMCWYFRNLETRPLTKQEQIEKSNFFMRIKDEVLRRVMEEQSANFQFTSLMFSLRYDLSFYIKRVLMQMDKSVKWSLKFTKDQNGNLPIIILKDKEIVNPIDTLEGLSYRHLEGKKDYCKTFKQVTFRYWIDGDFRKKLLENKIALKVNKGPDYEKHLSERKKGHALLLSLKKK